MTTRKNSVCEIFEDGRSNGRGSNISDHHSVQGVKQMVKAGMVLAPMAGVSDPPFRMICRSHGCDFAFTEMVDVNGIAYGNRKTIKYLDTIKGDSPLGAQIAGADPVKMRSGAIFCRDRGFKVIDINAGCPARKVVKGGKGAALMKDPLKLSRVLRAVTGISDIEVTIKIRSGWDGDTKNYLEIAKVAENEGVKAICVHPRTREEMYKGRTLSYAPVSEIKNVVKIPVFASGNVFSACDARNIMRNTGCDGVFVARGSFGNPWIFEKDIQSAGGSKVPDFENIKDVMRRHYDLAQGHFGSFLATKRMYKHTTWYLKRYKNLNAVMESYRYVKDSVSFFRFLDNISLEGRNLVIRGEGDMAK